MPDFDIVEERSAAPAAVLSGNAQQTSKLKAFCPFTVALGGRTADMRLVLATGRDSGPLGCICRSLSHGAVRAGKADLKSNELQTAATRCINDGKCVDHRCPDVSTLRPYHGGVFVTPREAFAAKPLSGRINSPGRIRKESS